MLVNFRINFRTTDESNVLIKDKEFDINVFTIYVVDFNSNLNLVFDDVADYIYQYHT